ncbi:MAG: FUSC family protein [Chloroflexi bacterium]|nr:FUSC family protein [Chloroflexota bacterium]
MASMVAVLSPEQHRLTGLARALRAAVAVPSLFALGLLVVRQPEAAGFAVFGTFAHLVMVTYDTTGRTRSLQCAALTVLGAATISLGTLLSAYAWLAVLGTMAVGFCLELPLLTRRRLAVLAPALVLSFMLAVATPAPGSAVLPHLAGWLLAGVAAQPVLLLLWVSVRTVSLDPGDHTQHVESTAWLANAASSGAALALAVLVTRLLRLDHQFWVVLGVVPVLSAKTTAAARTFWHEQAGTVTGFLVGAALVAVIGASQIWYWLVLPWVVFASAYASTAIGFVAGQAAFTVFAVVLFGILAPQQESVGFVRVEDIAIGGAISLAVAVVQQLGQRRQTS